MRISTRNTGKENGFSFVEILLVLVTLGAVAFVGVYVFNKQDKTPVVTNIEESSVQEQPEINNGQDLQTAEENLNDINLDELDTTELDTAETDLL